MLNMTDEEKLTLRKDTCLEEVSNAYYDVDSPYYRDNERFKWAVDTINKLYTLDIDAPDINGNIAKTKVGE